MTEVRVIRARHVPWQGRTIAYPKGWTGDVADDLAAHLCDSLGIARRTPSPPRPWQRPVERLIPRPIAETAPVVENKASAEPLGMMDESEDAEPDDLPIKARRSRRV